MESHVTKCDYKLKVSEEQLYNQIEPMMGKESSMLY